MQRSTAGEYSVLMSVYAKENPDFLRQSMQSIYDQTVPTNDFVLVCDGLLTVELDKVIEEMQEKFGKRLRVLRQGENRGLGASLGLGVKKCKNELIARMDADDVAREDRIEKQLEMFKNGDFDVVGSNIVEYDEGMKEIFGVRSVPEGDEDIKEYAKRRNPINHMSVCYRKSKVIEAGNYQDMPGFEDYYLWVRMMRRKCKFYNVQSSLVKVRGGTSMMKRRGGKNYSSWMRKFEKELKKMGFISFMEYCGNVVVRALSSAVPLSVRNGLYRRILRRRA